MVVSLYSTKKRIVVANVWLFQTYGSFKRVVSNTSNTNGMVVSYSFCFKSGIPSWYFQKYDISKSMVVAN